MRAFWTVVILSASWAFSYAVLDRFGFTAALCALPVNIALGPAIVWLWVRPRPPTKPLIPPTKLVVGDSNGMCVAHKHDGKVSKLLWVGHDMPPAGDHMLGWPVLLDGRRGTIVETTALTVTVVWD